MLALKLSNVGLRSIDFVLFSDLFQFVFIDVCTVDGIHLYKK